MAIIRLMLWSPFASASLDDRTPEELCCWFRKRSIIRAIWIDPSPWSVKVIYRISKDPKWAFTSARPGLHCLMHPSRSPGYIRAPVAHHLGAGTVLKSVTCISCGTALGMALNRGFTKRWQLSVPMISLTTFIVPISGVVHNTGLVYATRQPECVPVLPLLLFSLAKRCGRRPQMNTLLLSLRNEQNRRGCYTAL